RSRFLCDHSRRARHRPCQESLRRGSTCSDHGQGRAHCPIVCLARRRGYSMNSWSSVMNRRTVLSAAAFAAITVVAGSGGVRLQAAERGADPLPSWNDGPVKLAILIFVAKVTEPGGPDFVPVPE